MPNYITNILHLQGNQETLSKICPEPDKFSFSNTIPSPPNNPDPVISLNDPKSNWFVDNWGTKWDAIRAQIQKNLPNQIVIIFDTAWCPPDRWLSHIHLVFPSLQFDLVWADEDFPSSGHIYLENNLIKSVEYQYDDPEAL